MAVELTRDELMSLIGERADLLSRHARCGDSMSAVISKDEVTSEVVAQIARLGTLARALDSAKGGLI